MLCFAILVLDPSLLLSPDPSFKGAASMSWEASDKQGGRKVAGPQLTGPARHCVLAVARQLMICGLGLRREGPETPVAPSALCPCQSLPQHFSAGEVLGAATLPCSPLLQHPQTHLFGICVLSNIK